MRRKSKYTVKIISGLAVLVFLWQAVFVFNIFSSFAINIASPFLRVGNYAQQKSSEFSAFLTSKQNLAEEIQKLKKKITLLETKNITHNLLVRENKELKMLLGRHDEESERVLASVLSRPNSSPYDSIIIDAGAREKIAKGYIVVADGDILIGVVEKVHIRTSVVRLFSSPGVEIDVVLGDNNVAVVARGRGAGNFDIRLPKGVPMEAGESILFPAFSTQVIGVVETVLVKPNDSFQTILFKSPVNIFELKWVEVILAENETEL